jgi:malonate transporter and related proteins
MPAVTFLALTGLGIGREGILFKVALIMAALPTGAGVYIFAIRHRIREDDISLLIVISLCLSIPTIAGLLLWLG